jgi:hypothetical protein
MLREPLLSMVMDSARVHHGADVQVAYLDEGLADERRGQTGDGKVALHDFGPARGMLVKNMPRRGHNPGASGSLS